MAHLSDEELEIARLVSEGLTNHQIAQRLHYAYGTVCNRILYMYGKLGMSRKSSPRILLATWYVKRMRDANIYFES